MPILTLAAIDQNPWNAVRHPLPAERDCVLLDIAYCAVLGCLMTQQRLMVAAQVGAYEPARCKAAQQRGPFDKRLSASTYNEARWIRAMRRANQIAERLRSSK